MKRVWMRWPDNDLFAVALYKGKLWYVDMYKSTSRLYLHRVKNPIGHPDEERDILEMVTWDYEHGNKPEWDDVREYKEWNSAFQEKLKGLERLI